MESAMGTEAGDALLRVADVVGGLMEFWGFRRNMGRLWCVLYLEAGPLSAAELGERLSLSAGAVSMTLNDLAEWGVVKKAWVPGERREYYEPETDIWKMVSRVFRERELTQIGDAIGAFDAALAALLRSRSGAERAEVQRLDFAVTRIRGLKALAEVGKRLLSTVLSGEAVDVSPLARFRSGDSGEER
jgi:DNA-binding transcriptional regulator GbsR (MarR family)